MRVLAIDHLNLRIPAEGVETAVSFYRDVLGFEIEGRQRYESGKKPFFDVRLTPESILHLWPTEEFAEPSGNNYNHVAFRVEESIDEVKSRLRKGDVDIERELDAPLGATGEAPAVYIRDPFGYRVELKQSIEAGSPVRDAAESGESAD